MQVHEGALLPIRIPVIVTSSSSHALGGARAWFTWSLSAMAFGYAFFQRVAPSVMVSDLMSDFAIGGGMLGVLSALYFYPYVILQVPLGAILERLGARLLLFFALTIAGAGSLLFAGADSLPIAYLGRVMIGIGSAVGFLGSLSLVSRWFPPNRFALLSGMTMFIGLMSGVMAQGPLSLFVEEFGWRNSQLALAAFGIALALTILIFVRNGPETASVEKPKVQSWASVGRGLMRAIRTGDTWKIALVAGSMSGPMLTLGGLWAPPYLMEAYALSRSDAAFIASLMLFGWAIGAPLSGFLSDRMDRRSIFLKTGAFVLTVALGVIAFVPDLPLPVTVFALVIAGASGGIMVTAFALVRETFPAQIANPAIGIINGMTVAAGAVLQPVVGATLDLLAPDTAYTASDYRAAFISIFIVSLGGFLLSLTLKGKHSLSRLV